jgi:WD40 repeat protein
MRGQVLSERSSTDGRSLVTDAEFSPDSRLPITTSDDHDGRVWEIATGRLLHVLRRHFFPEGDWDSYALHRSGGGGIKGASSSPPRPAA